MIISVASGKGGTGKTTIATSLALSLVAEDTQLLDCDAEEPNAAIFIHPQIVEKRPVVIAVPKVDEEKCQLCGKCTKLCAFNAMAIINNKLLIYPELCHSCGVCQHFCPVGAIYPQEQEVGTIEFGYRGDLAFIQGQLNVGEAMPTHIIKAVKSNLDLAKIVIIDAPPGTSCPVIEAIKGSDFTILVTEPTPFGLNDLILAVEMSRKMQIPLGVVINRSDLGDYQTHLYCEQENIPILMEIPFQKRIAVAYSKGIPLVEIIPEYQALFRQMLTKINELIL